MGEPAAFVLYDGPIGNPFCTSEELLASVNRLRSSLQDPSAYTREGRAQVEALVARGEAQLAEGRYREAGLKPR